MRRAFALFAFSTTACAYGGDGFLGTKVSPPAGPMQADTGGVGIMSFLQMMVALGIVLILLKFVMPKLATKLNKRIVTKVGSEIQIEETAAFAGGSLYIVRAKSKTLLLSVNAQGVSCLADLSERKVSPDLPTFQEIVDREIEGPLQPFAVVENIQEFGPGPDAQASEAAAALERLKRLTG